MGKQHADSEIIVQTGFVQIKKAELLHRNKVRCMTVLPMNTMVIIRRNIMREGTELTARLSDGEKVINAHSRYFEERLPVIGTVNMETAGNKKISLHLLECNLEEKSGLLVTKMMIRPKQ